MPKPVPFGFAKVFSLLIIGLFAGLAVWMHYRLPDVPIATHFGVDGEANGFMPRDVGLAIGPISMTVIVGILWLVPKVMPNNGKLERSELAYGTIWVAVLGLMAMIHGMIFAIAVGLKVDIVMGAGLGMALLLIVIGNVLPKMRFNYMAGIKTPWTLADERVWDKTHRLGGYLFVLGGVGLAASILLLPVPYIVPAILMATLVPSLAAAIYSYVVARKLGAA